MTTTYCLVQRNETFAIAVNADTDEVQEFCGPIDSSDMPKPGEPVDLRTWHYDTGDYDELAPWRPEVAILASQEAGDNAATWFIEAGDDGEDGEDGQS